MYSSIHAHVCTVLFTVRFFCIFVYFLFFKVTSPLILCYASFSMYQLLFLLCILLFLLTVRFFCVTVIHHNSISIHSPIIMSFHYINVPCHISKHFFFVSALPSLSILEFSTKPTGNPFRTLPPQLHKLHQLHFLFQNFSRISA